MGGKQSFMPDPRHACQGGADERASPRRGRRASRHGDGRDGPVCTGVRWGTSRRGRALVAAPPADPVQGRDLAVSLAVACVKQAFARRVPPPPSGVKGSRGYWEGMS